MESRDRLKAQKSEQPAARTERSAMQAGRSCADVEATSDSDDADADPTLPRGVCVDLDNADRADRTKTLYRAYTPSWCSARGQPRKFKRGFSSIEAATAWRMQQIRRAKEQGKVPGRRTRPPPPARPQRSRDEILAGRRPRERSARNVSLSGKFRGECAPEPLKSLPNEFQLMLSSD